MHGGQVLRRAGRQRPVELGQRARGGQGLGALDQVAFELASQVALEAVELVAVDRRQLGGAVARLALRLRPRRELQRAADPLHVDADHARALALAAEGGDRQPRQVAHLALVAVEDRLADLLAQLVDVEPLGALVALLGLADLALDRLRLGGAEEPALEEQLEQPPVLLRLGDRRRQRLAEVVARLPGHLLERGEGVEDLRGADRDALAAQLLAEAEQLRRQARGPARRSARGGRVPGVGKLHPHSLGDQVDVGAVLDDDRHRLLEGLAVDVLGAHQQQRPRPVDRLGDRGRLLQVERPHHPHHLDQPPGQRLRELRRVQADDLHLALQLRVVEPEVEAASLQRLGQLARVVRGEDDDRHRRRRDLAQLGDRDLEVGEQLEQHRLELLVGLVDLVDQQHDRLGAGDRLHQRPRQQELVAEDVVVDVVPAGLAAGLDAQQLLAVVPLVQRLGLVEALVALQADQLAAAGPRQRLGQLGLADPRRALDQDRLAEPLGEEGDQRGRLVGEVARRRQRLLRLGDGCGCAAL